MTTREQAARELLERRRARAGLLPFLRKCWWMPHPLVIGRHTIAIANRLTRAVADLREGKSTFLLIAVPFRHGKSDIVSRALPAWFLGTCRDLEPDVIMSGYGVSLVRSFSKRVKTIMQQPEYQSLFPGVLPSRGSNSSEEWAVTGSAGVVTAQGLGGGLAGKGGMLIICDDYCKNRSEARSETYRQKTWDSFTNDLLTRRAPASIVICCATPWHVDDVRGRILKKMKQDPEFPQFEELRFPARDPEGGFLFPERFPESWYRSQYATLQRLASGLLDCDPNVEGGNRFQTDAAHVIIHSSLSGWPVGRETRGWDLASSTKERDGEDPDWTFGVRGLVKKERMAAAGPGAFRHHIWIRDIVAVRAEATARNELIRKTAVADGVAVGQAIEAFGAYKDAYTTLRDILRGCSIVKKMQLPGDKSAKAAPMEPSFEAGYVHILDGPNVREWLKQFSEFPDGDHDDAVDATAVMFHANTSGASGILC